MEERDQILIERYLAGELTQDERYDVERRRSEDPIFHQEIIEYEEAVQALRQKQREELMQRFIRRDEILDQKKPEELIVVRHRYTWLWGAAVLLALVVLWRFFSTKNPQPIPSPINSTDTTRIDQPPTVRIDTTNLKDTVGNQQQIEKPKKDRPDMAANTKKGQEFFAEYFEPYKDAMMDPTTRGDEELSPLQKYQKTYWDGEYDKAVDLFQQLSTDNQGNENYRFSYANALLEAERTEEAITILKSIIQKNQSRYKTESRFVLALAYLNKGDGNSAIPLLDHYLQDEKAKQRDKAGKLKKALIVLQKQ